MSEVQRREEIGRFRWVLAGLVALALALGAIAWLDGPRPVDPRAICAETYDGALGRYLREVCK
jgi:hypothetical protein